LDQTVKFIFQKAYIYQGGDILDEHILITGGAGFIGRALSVRLLEKGYAVTVIDNLDPQVHGKNPDINFFKTNKINFIQGSILDYELLGQAIQNQDYIIHLAAHTATGQSMYRIAEDTNINVLGTAKLMDYIVNNPHNIQKIVIASSRAVYGEGVYRCPYCGRIPKPKRIPEDLEKGLFELFCPYCRTKLVPLPTDEESSLNPLSIYGASKVSIEYITSLSGAAAQIPFTILRYQNVYGPGQSLGNPYTGILSVLGTCLLNNAPIYVFEDGQESRDFIYIDDAVSAILGVLKSEATNDQIYNIGTGIRTPVCEMATLLIKEFGSHSEYIINGKYRIGDIRHNFADISKAFYDFGFVPQISLDKGIQKFVSWFSMQEIPQNNLIMSIKEMEDKNMLRGGRDHAYPQTN